jgi:prevent-host-death family protein
MGTVIRASDFKATCLALLDDVAASRQEYVITKRGRPVARLVPIEAPMPINGSASQSPPAS